MVCLTAHEDEHSVIQKQPGPCHYPKARGQHRSVRAIAAGSAAVAPLRLHPSSPKAPHRASVPPAASSDFRLAPHASKQPVLLCPMLTATSAARCQDTLQQSLPLESSVQKQRMSSLHYHY